MARPKRNYIPVIPVVLLIALIVPVSGAGFFPEGGTATEPVEIGIDWTIEAWIEYPQDTGVAQDNRWRYNPQAFAIVSGDEHSRNVTFITIKDTGKPEAISYGPDCSDRDNNVESCSRYSFDYKRYWRIVNNPAPVAGFSATIEQDRLVRFTDTSSGFPKSWTWDFGDGSGSAERDPEHTYSSPGKYRVTLVTVNSGGNDTVTRTVDFSLPLLESDENDPGTFSLSRAVLDDSFQPEIVTLFHFNVYGPINDLMGRQWYYHNLMYNNTTYKFGGGSAFFSNTWFHTEDDPVFSPGSQNFTFSVWIYPTSNLSGYGAVWGNWIANQGGTSLDFYGGVPRVVIDNSGTTQIIAGTTPLPVNTWSNVVLQGKNVSGSSDITLYINGIPQRVLNGAYNIRKPVSQTDMFIGMSSTQYYLLKAGTIIDDFFIVKGGPALYEGPFAPSAIEFGPPEMTPDLNDEVTPVSVIHFNTSGTVDDETGHIWEFHYLAFNNTLYKFGGGSALFNGNTWLATNDTPEFSPGRENFTFSVWVYPTSNLSGYGAVWGNWIANQGGSSLDFYGGVPRIVMDNLGRTQIITGSTPLPVNNWSNIVLQGKNNGWLSDITLYVNGVPNGTLSGPYFINEPATQTRFYSGIDSSTRTHLLQVGTYVDDFFIVKGGPAMYEGPFTPPTQEFGSLEVPPQTEYRVYADGVSLYHGFEGNIDLPRANNTAKEFYTNISGKQGDPYSSIHWVGIGNPVDNATGSKNWNINEDANLMANNADFALHAGHGWNEGILFGTANSDYKLYRSDMQFGGNNGKAKWVALYSCSVLDQATKDNWKSVFDGLHILMAFDTIGVEGRNQGSQFAQRMTGDGIYPVPEKIREAWMKSLKDTINDVSIKGAYMYAEPSGEDFLPGFGTFREPVKDSNGQYSIAWDNFNCSRDW